MEKVYRLHFSALLFGFLAAAVTGNLEYNYGYFFTFRLCLSRTQYNIPARFWLGGQWLLCHALDLYLLLVNKPTAMLHYVQDLIILTFKLSGVLPFAATDTEAQI